MLTDPALEGTLQNLHRTSHDLSGIAADLRTASDGRDWAKTLDDFEGAAGAARRASEALATRLEAVPEDAFERITGRGDRVLVSLEASLRQMNSVLDQLELLVRNVGRNPNRLLSRPPQEEPFAR